jgi:hypothetical protein
VHPSHPVTEYWARQQPETDPALTSVVAFAEEVMAKARSLAGPEDAKTMVGVDFGGLKIM